MIKPFFNIAMVIALSVGAQSAHASTLNTGDRLTINPGVYTTDNNGNISNATVSWFGGDANGDGNVTDYEKVTLSQGTEGIIIGVIQGTGTPTHAGAPTATDWNRITAPYSWFGETAQEYTTSPITGSSESGLDFSGLNWPWNGIENIDFGGGAWGVGFANGIANFVWDGIYGHRYALDYHTSIAAGDPSNLGGIRFAYHLEGTVQPVPLPASVVLLSSGLVCLIGFGRRKLAALC